MNTETNPPVTTEDAVRSREAEITLALRESGELGAGDRIAELAQLSGGWSRHSYVATAQLAAGGTRSYIVRVEAPGGVLDTDLEAEYALYRALDGEDHIATPSVYHFAGSTENAFGNRFIIMEHVDGVAPNAFRRTDREWLEQDWRGERGIANDMVENLARLHTFSHERLPAGTVPELGFLDVVDRWSGIYEQRRLIRDPVTEEAVHWLRERVPADTQTGVVHGDYRVGNTLVEGGRITAILDWEIAYVGDVRFDLGYLALQRLAGKHLRPATPLLNAFAEADWFFDRYAELTGRPVDREVVRTFSVLGIMMLLATHYMGFWMYVNGHSTDFRLAWNRFGLIGLRQDLTELMAW